MLRGTYFSLSQQNPLKAGAVSFCSDLLCLEQGLVYSRILDLGLWQTRDGRRKGGREMGEEREGGRERFKGLIQERWAKGQCDRGIVSGKGVVCVLSKGQTGPMWHVRLGARVPRSWFTSCNPEQRAHHTGTQLCHLKLFHQKRWQAVSDIIRALPA